MNAAKLRPIRFILSTPFAAVAMLAMAISMGVTMVGNAFIDFADWVAGN